MSSHPSVIGHIDLGGDQSHWYELNDGTVVSFHTAYTNKERTRTVMFVSDDQTWPSITAAKLGINYYFMRNSTPEEISGFLVDTGISLKATESDNRN